jgi:hypothetical protein
MRLLGWQAATLAPAQAMAIFIHGGGQLNLGAIGDTHSKSMRLHKPYGRHDTTFETFVNFKLFPQPGTPTTGSLDGKQPVAGGGLCPE